MNMNRIFFSKKGTRTPKWVVIDAKDRILGRLATEIADILRGKHTPLYTPHADTGDYVIVINAHEVALSGNKWENKEYHSYSGWMGGLKSISAKDLAAKAPERIIELAVKRMLPKNKLADAMIKKLRVYKGSEHPHQGQVA